MIQIQSSDVDPDPVMMFHDDPDPVMMLHDDLDREMIQIQWRWLEYEDNFEDDEDLTMTYMIQRRRLVLINCVKRIPS